MCMVAGLYTYVYLGCILLCIFDLSCIHMCSKVVHMCVSRLYTYVYVCC